MDVLELERRLTELGLYDGRLDEAIEALFAAENVDGTPFVHNQSRFVLAGMQTLLKHDGHNPGPIDGLRGRRTNDAMKHYDVVHWRDDKMNHAAHPTVSQGKWPLQRDCLKFFGTPGTHQVTVAHLPYPLRGDDGQEMHSLSCHRLVSESVRRALDRVLQHYGHERIKALNLDVYDGCCVVRRMRGGRAWSMHSWGIALDFDAAENELTWGRERARFGGDEYLEWFLAWEAEGAVSLGRACNMDWMHVQFARVR
jgi:hypothetical protein